MKHAKRDDRAEMGPDMEDYNDGRLHSSQGAGVRMASTPETRLPPQRLILLVTVDPDKTPIDEVPSPGMVCAEIQAHVEHIWPGVVVDAVVCG